MIDPILWVVPTSSVIALLFAYYFYRDMMSYSEGTDLMKKIARHVRGGIFTNATQKEMLLPSILAIFIPIGVGILFGIPGVMGLLLGSTDTRKITAGFY